MAVSILLAALVSNAKRSIFRHKAPNSRAFRLASVSCAQNLIEWHITDKNAVKVLCSTVRMHQPMEANLEVQYYGQLALRKPVSENCRMSKCADGLIYVRIHPQRFDLRYRNLKEGYRKADAQKMDHQELITWHLLTPTSEGLIMLNFFKFILERDL